MNESTAQDSRMTNADSDDLEIPNPANDIKHENHALAAPSTEGLEARIEALEAENAALKDRSLRAMAEAENTRRRAQKEREDTIRYAVSEFARSLLSVADNFARALQAVKPDERSKNQALDNLLAGVEAVERELQQIFEMSGMRKINPVDQAFDPNVHEVMFEVENSGKAPGTIVQVIQTGYTLHDRLLRPARVAVAKGEMEERHVDQSV